VLYIADSATEIKPQAVPFFDRLHIRVVQPFNQHQEAFLRAHADSVNPVLSKYPFWHGRSRRWSKRYYCIVAPDDEALRYIARLSTGDHVLNVIELALDLIVDNTGTKLALLNVFDTSFVQGWHQQQVGHYLNGGTTTGQRRRYFAWYADKPSKWTDDPHVLHLECRLIGLPVLRTNHIDQQHLVSFDHAAFWQRHLNLFAVDLEILGRTLSNQDTGQRRSRIDKRDRMRGGLFYRWINYQRMHDIGHDSFSVQHLIDGYGRGPFLHRIQHSLLMSMSTKPQRFCNPLPPLQKTPLSPLQHESDGYLHPLTL
jgi:hypothetical protein